MKVYIILTSARQVEGDMVQLRIEDAFIDFDKADQAFQKLRKVQIETMDVPHQGGIEKIQFYCQRSLHEVVVKE